MALANVGFLAAMAGKRVLLMDWDLEAPGLAYYFRGMTDHADSRRIRTADGILDLFWIWTSGIRSAKSKTALDEHVRTFRSGALFDQCTRSLVSELRLPDGARLDFIGAGSPTIRAPDLVPYADALARFSWTDFFEQSAGGIMIEALRNWCRDSYDVILVDSRTGLADVAGICTMQLPDAVLLCFVLNRQNIEGISQVATAVKGSRGDAVQLRICPMRVSQDRPTEEADARARAHRHLQRAGLDLGAVEADMERIAIPVAGNVPFYETLAPFSASDPAHDVLTLAYQTLTETLTGVELYRPKIDSAWREQVRRRLEPKLTTVEYLKSLEHADPGRAREEIDRYLLGAIDADPAVELDRDYVEALVSAAFSIAALSWDSDSKDSEVEAKEVAKNAVDLLRRLNALSDGDWRLRLVDALEDLDVYFGSRDAGGRYAELDDILEAGPQDLEILQRRISLTLSEARSQAQGRSTQSLRMTDKARSLLDAMRELADADAAVLALAEGEIGDVRSAVLMKSNPSAARREALLALDALSKAAAGISASTISASLHLRIARVESAAADAERHLLEAAKIWPRSVVSDMPTYTWAVETLLNGPDFAAAALAFVNSVFGTTQRRVSARRPVRSSIPIMLDSQEAIRFATTTERLALAVSETRKGSAERALGALAEVSGQVLSRTLRRQLSRRSARSSASALIKNYAHLHDTLIAVGAPKGSLDLLSEVIISFDRPRSEDT
ncbi:hypothetical protein STHU_14780 [Allostella humosa]|nr:hypothetical protein [Stella humosa]BBK30844.1 hypothetical protein STHU_14780 [Stella humosa]